LARQTYALKQVSVTNGLQVSFTTINDYSGITAERSSPVGVQ